ncbi:MAG: sulfotransferase family 2 domain-containing protein, partial [Pseudomonadota bacterium]
MMVFYKERLVFLSVPKTGTTALQSALGDRADMTVTAPPELKHMPLFRYNRFMRPMFDKVLDAQMETMAVIREPVDWLGSWYRFRRRPGFEGHRNATHDMSFDDFVTAYVREQRPSFANVGSQAKFVEPR